MEEKLYRTEVVALSNNTYMSRSALIGTDRSGLGKHGKAEVVGETAVRREIVFFCLNQLTYASNWHMPFAVMNSF